MLIISTVNGMQNLVFVDIAVKELGIEEVKSLSGIDAKLLPSIYNTIRNELTPDLQVRGYLTTIKGGNRVDSRYVCYDELHLSKANLKDIDDINQLVQEEKRIKWWSQKSV